MIIRDMTFIEVHYRSSYSTAYQYGTNYSSLWGISSKKKEIKLFFYFENLCLIEKNKCTTDSYNEQ